MRPPNSYLLLTPHLNAEGEERVAGRERVRAREERAIHLEYGSLLTDEQFEPGGGVASRGVVRCGVMWCDVVWCGVAWCGVVVAWWWHYIACALTLTKDLV